MAALERRPALPWLAVLALVIACLCALARPVLGTYSQDKGKCPMIDYKGMVGKASTDFKVLKWIKGKTLKECCKACAYYYEGKCDFYEYDLSAMKCTMLHHEGGNNCRVDRREEKCRVVPKGKCTGTVMGDPHFVGAHNTRYDFNGHPNETYCLITDKEVQVNMAIEGVGKLPHLQTWITGLSIFWTAGGKEHTFMMRARPGAGNERGTAGFLLEARADGQQLPRFEGNSPEVVTVAESDLTFHFGGLGEYKGVVTEKYAVSVANVINMVVVVRPMLGRTGHSDAYVHFDLEMGRVAHTADVHGVLGQTYRSDREERTRYYQKVAANLKGAMRALEAGSGEGFLDGVLADYRTPDLMDPSCVVSRFNGRVPLKGNEWNTPPSITTSTQ